VAEFAAVHLLAAIPNALMLERMEPDWGGRAQATEPALICSEGHITAPLRPGLGVQIDADFVAAHPSQRNTALPSGGWNPGTEGQTLYLQPRQPRATITLPGVSPRTPTIDS
jgi:galactonate dehydratase